MTQACIGSPTREDVSLQSDFTSEQREKVNEILMRYRGRPGALIPVLKDVQDITGYLPLSLQKEISRGLNLAYSEVYGVVTFYSFFNLEPRGRHVIKVCLGTACYVKGNKDLVETISRELHCAVGGMTEDRRFSMEGVRCLGCCGIAPVITIDEEVYPQIRAKQMSGILEKHP